MSAAPRSAREAPLAVTGKDFTRQDVAHLLRRVGFGGHVAEIDALGALPSWAAIVDRVLDTTANPADTIPAIIDTGSGWESHATAVQYWVERMATSPTPIVEKMTLLWHGLFTSSFDAIHPRVLFRQVRTWRAHALGNLHPFAQAMAVDPAMLDYLDNRSNVKGNPNENFAREVMELFLLGQGSYVEADVAQVARAWTGHGLDDQNRYWFDSTRHDYGSKTIFGITRNWDGPEVITEIVRGTRQQACARWIVGKVWAFLAGPAPSATVRDALVAAFIAADMDIKALVRAVLLRPEFRSPEVKTGLLRSPAELMAVIRKATGVPIGVLHPEWGLETSGQILYGPPNVSGWRQNQGWVSTSNAWGRAGYAAYVRWKAPEHGLFAGYEALPSAEAVDRALRQFMIDEPSPVTRDALIAYLDREKAAGRGWAVASGLTAGIIMSPDLAAA